MPLPDPDPSARPSRLRWMVCGLLLLATTLNYMDRVALNQTAVRVQMAFGLSAEEYGWLEGGFSFAFAIGTLTTGFIVDRVGVRWVYPVVVTGWSAAGFLTGFSQTYTFLLTCRIALGLFEAGNWPCGIRTVRQVMAPKERSLGNALFQSGTALGAVITPYIVLICIHWADPDEPARLAHFALGGGAATAATGTPPDAWQLPFRVIGAIGLVWVALWLILVPGRALTPVGEAAGANVVAGAFYRVFLDRRFWILVVVVMGVNTTWHTFRVWLPPFLQRERGFSEPEMAWFTTLYYLMADVGSWTVGLTSLGLVSLGVGLHRSREITFAACVLFALASVAVPFLGRGPGLTAALLATGFGALGMFATYFALSQELSARHQGKVTGSLGFINAIYLGVVFPSQGRIIDLFGSSERVLATAGLPAVAALVAVLVFWPRERAGAVTTPEGSRHKV
jgi:ACS family hexuronate transporter-like MFS transporter